MLYIILRKRLAVIILIFVLNVYEITRSYADLIHMMGECVCVCINTYLERRSLVMSEEGYTTIMTITANNNNRILLWF